MYRKPELLIEWTQNQLDKMFALMLIGQELGKVMDFMLATKLELVKLLGALASVFVPTSTPVGPSLSQSAAGLPPAPHPTLFGLAFSNTG